MAEAVLRHKNTRRQRLNQANQGGPTQNVAADYIPARSANKIPQ
jgi:hypothetical protein